MRIEKAKPEQIDEIMAIYDHAKEFMKASGNGNQWINGYPQKKLIEKNISDGNLYDVYDDKGDLSGVFFYNIEEDPTYARIDNGAWLNDKPYGVLHRIASNGKIKGITDKCIDYIFSQCGNLRADTHKENIVMQKLLERNGFVECGIIYTNNGDERIAYQKVK